MTFIAGQTGNLAGDYFKNITLKNITIKITIKQYCILKHFPFKLTKHC